MMEAIGWFGGILLAICAVPMAWQSYKDGHSKGINMSFLQLWFWGEVLVLIYVLPKGHFPLIFNYGLNIVLIGIILWYKLRPRQ